MAQLTRSNIAYDLSISPHSLINVYGDEEIEFVFSSELYKTKFSEKQKKHRDQINNSLTKRFGFTVKNPLIADLRLYTTIEKRGFLIIKNGVELRCPEQIELDGARVITKSSGE